MKEIALGMFVAVVVFAVVGLVSLGHAVVKALL